MIKHEGHGAGLGERAAAFGEIRAHLARCPVAVVGQGLDDDGDAAWRIAFIADFGIGLGIGSRCLFDGALDIVLRHVFRAGGQDGGAQPRIHGRIGQAQFRGDGNFAGELGKELGADRILLALFMHDVFELAMSRHSVLVSNAAPPRRFKAKHLRAPPPRGAGSAGQGERLGADISQQFQEIKQTQAWVYRGAAVEKPYFTVGRRLREQDLAGLFVERKRRLLMSAALA